MKLLIPAGLLVGSMLCFAQVAPPPSASTVPPAETNGRMWVQAPYVLKLGIVMGFEMGQEAAFLSLYKKGDAPDTTFRQARRIYPVETPHGEVVAFLDQFFGHPENLTLHVWDGIETFARKLQGQTDAEIDEHLSILRKIANQ